MKMEMTNEKLENVFDLTEGILTEITDLNIILHTITNQHTYLATISVEETLLIN